MMKQSSVVQKAWMFFKANYIPVVLIGIVCITVLLAGVKTITAKNEYIYAKVKVSQGMWWANTQRPNVWFAEAIQPGITSNNLSSNPSAEILARYYYPWRNTDTYDIYVVVKLKVNKNERTGMYSYNRSPIGVSAPIDLKFPSVLFSGTIMHISEEPFIDDYTEKTIVLEKKHAPDWEFDEIIIGETYHNGEEVVLEVIDKSISKGFSVYSASENYDPIQSDFFESITVTLKLKVKEKNGEIYYGDEYIVRKNKYLNISTERLLFEGYRVVSIE